MDYDKVDAESFGARLRGIGLNLLVRDVLEQITVAKSRAKAL